MIKISNIKASNLVNEKLEFRGNNTFAKWLNGIYKVYSYGYHFPIYAFKAGVWYRNIGRWSRTTSKHQSQLRPAVEKFIEVNTLEIKAI